jgi:hypothetical protein
MLAIGAQSEVTIRLLRNMGFIRCRSDNGSRRSKPKSLFEGKRGLPPGSAESAPDRLYGEIGLLKMELDWLKKIWDQLAMIRRGWIGAHAALTHCSRLCLSQKKKP